jgi:hypothetical protein
MVTLIHCCCVQAMAVVRGCGCLRARFSVAKFVRGSACPWARFSAGMVVLRGRGFPRVRVAGAVFCGYGCPRARFSASAVQTNLMHHFIAIILYYLFSLCSSNLKHTSCHRYRTHPFLFSLPFLLVATLRSSPLILWCHPSTFHQIPCFIFPKKTSYGSNHERTISLIFLAGIILRVLRLKVKNQ